MSLEWRVYTRPKALGNPLHAIKEPPAVHVGFISGDGSWEALGAAVRRYSGYERLSVVAVMAWRIKSELERSVFLGTFVPPTEVHTVAGVRHGLCRLCGLEITDPPVLGPGLDKRRRGRPRQWHDVCAPPRVKMWRRREAR